MARVLFADLTRKSIARRLKLRLSSVRYHLDGVYQKTGSKDRLQLVRCVMATYFQLPRDGSGGPP